MVEPESTNSDQSLQMQCQFFSNENTQGKVEIIEAEDAWSKKLDVINESDSSFTLSLSGGGQNYDFVRISLFTAGSILKFQVSTVDLDETVRHYPTAVSQELEDPKIEIKMEDQGPAQNEADEDENPPSDDGGEDDGGEDDGGEDDGG